jgi:tRNA A37 N6-isopentenylltransferase MiaA
MSWIGDKLNFCNTRAHEAQKQNAHTYSNARLHSELKDVEAQALKKMRETECGKMIRDLWLSRCEESLPESAEERIYPSSQIQGDKVSMAGQVAALRRSWKNNAA